MYVAGHHFIHLCDVCLAPDVSGLALSIRPMFDQHMLCRARNWTRATSRGCLMCQTLTLITRPLTDQHALCRALLQPHPCDISGMPDVGHLHSRLQWLPFTQARLPLLGSQWHWSGACDFNMWIYVLIMTQGIISVLGSRRHWSGACDSHQPKLHCRLLPEQAPFLL